jgi:two-component system chemotaxis sensor kinase CheA
VDDKFREMFFEEARELLIGLEEGLMELERRQGDRAHLDKTFRAAHSLKGAAAMVGLQLIARFTHGIEAVLEKIRGGSLAVDSDIITTLLEARDHLAAMVEGEAAGSPIPASGDLSQRLSDLLRGPSSPAEPPPAAPARTPLAATGSPEPAQSTTKSQGPGVIPVPVEKAASGPLPDLSETPAIETKRRAPRRQKKGEAGVGAKSSRAKGSRADHPALPPPPDLPGSFPTDLPDDDGRASYRITLALGPDTLRRGVNPLGVLDELRELGECTITTDPQNIPLLEDLDPERSYLSWTISVITDASPDRVKEVFLLVSDDSSVHIEHRQSDGTMAAVPWDTAAPPQGFAPEPRDLQAGARAARGDLTPGQAAPAETATAGGLTRGLQPSGPLTPLPTNGSARAPTQVGGLSPFPGSRPHARIRVDAVQLDDLVGLAGELVVLSDNLQGLRDEPSVAHWLHALESLERVSREIRDTTLDLRMVPVDELFSRFPRVVRDLADQSHKEIELRIIGQDTRLDRTIVERLGDPMVHLIRNAVDHALEPPSERLEKGKPRQGKITLVAGHEGDRVAIRVEDDGRGLDRSRIVQKAIARNMIPQGTSPDDPRVVSLIFEPGFSTRDEVSEMSGRGVGLDVVRDSVRALRGSLSVESTPGKGTAFVFRLPLTLALIDGLLVESAGGVFVVPLAQVEECVALNGTSPALARERPCVSVRGELVPMISLRRLFRTNGPLPARQELLLTRHAGQRIGVAVDRLVGRVQAVIQSLGEGLHGLTRFSGATILGDGSVSLILDLSAVVSESLVADQGTYATPS